LTLNLNPNPNLSIQTIEFQTLHCLKIPKQRILKSMDFKFKSRSKCCHPNTTL